jgi:hypothetical protein
MSREKALLLPLLLMGCIIAVCTCATIAAKVGEEVVDIRDGQGNVLIAADVIQSYDWRSHILTLAPGERAKLAAKLMQSGHIVPGVPFELAVGGKTVYAGKFTTCVSSISLPGMVIVVDAKVLEPSLGEDQLRIQLGYPGSPASLICGIDPRNNEQLHAALRSAGKLAKAPPEIMQWVADSLREMQTVKAGMTRAELLRVFEEEGGLSTRTEQRFAYRDCPLIKVNVKFEAVGAADEVHTKSPNDTIREISPPFLEWSIGD